jgi:hypothetical protein
MAKGEAKSKLMHNRLAAIKPWENRKPDKRRPVLVPHRSDISSGNRRSSGILREIGNLVQNLD